MNIKYPSVSETAQQVLRDIEAEEQIKTAELQILRNVSSGVTVEEARDLVKLAQRCRQVNTDNPEISYDDLRNFMAQCNA